MSLRVREVGDLRERYCQRPARRRYGDRTVYARERAEGGWCAREVPACRGRWRTRRLMRRVALKRESMFFATPPPMLREVIIGGVREKAASRQRKGGC